jgi:hypothetical protein
MAPPYGYGTQQPAMQVQLTLDEQYLLERGYISDNQRIGGGLASLLFGLGIGQAIQGRWTETGWIFTLGETATAGMFVWGFFDLFLNCWEGPCSDRRQTRDGWLIVGGLIGNTVFRIWDVVDAFQGPTTHNRRLRELQMRLGMPVPMYTRVTPYVLPSRDGDGATAGLSLRF